MRAAANRRATIVVALVALLTVGACLFQLSTAGFAGTTDSAGGWASGTVQVTDDAAGVALFDPAQDGLLDGGDTAEHCIQVTYTGTITTNVHIRMYATASGPLAPYLDTVITEGTGGGAGSCDGFTPGKTVYTGTLASLPGFHGSFNSGMADWNPSAPGHAKTYRIRTTVQDTNAAKAKTATATFTWEARSVFNPPSGIVLWLNAKDLTGPTVTTWPDRSGKDHDGVSSAIGTAATQDPALVQGVTPKGGPAVQFGARGRAATAVHKALQLPNLGLTSAGEIWALIYQSPTAFNVGADSPGLWTFAPRSADASQFPYRNFATDYTLYEQFGLSSRVSWTPPKTTPLGGWFLYRVSVKDGTFDAWINGQLEHHATGKTVAWSPSPILGRSLATSATYDAQMGGQIAEVIVRDQVSTPAEAEAITAYFNSEHGLSIPNP